MQGLCLDLAVKVATGEEVREEARSASFRGPEDLLNHCVAPALALFVPAFDNLGDCFVWGICLHESSFLNLGDNQKESVGWTASVCVLVACEKKREWLQALGDSFGLGNRPCGVRFTGSEVGHSERFENQLSRLPIVTLPHAISARFTRICEIAHGIMPLGRSPLPRFIPL